MEVQTTVQSVEGQQGVEGRGGRLLRAILAATIRYGEGRDCHDSPSAGKILTQPGTYALYGHLLERHGITIASERMGPRSRDGNNGKVAFVLPALLLGQLLPGSGWTKDDARKALIALPGARPYQRAIAGRRALGVDIPLALVQQIVNERAE